MSQQLLILVDEQDNPIGFEEKVQCHLADGQLHRAFTALLFNPQGKLLLTRRAKEKMLWPGDWDGTFASHPVKGDSYVSAGERRMPQELGVSASLDYLNKFTYQAVYKDIGAEYELCGTLIGILTPDKKIKLIEDEIDEIKWVSAAELKVLLTGNPHNYCPWMLMAIALLELSDQFMQRKYHDTLSAWMQSDVTKVMLDTIELQGLSDKWKFVAE